MMPNCKHQKALKTHACCQKILPIKLPVIIYEKHLTSSDSF